MATPEENRRTVEQFWADMHARRWDAFTAHFTQDATYTDAPTPDDEFARGPAEILARLRLAIDPLESMGDERGQMIADDRAVVTEHVEVWTWTTGEQMRLPIVSIHELSDGRITRRIDYWDMQTLVNTAPQAWFEHVMAGYK